MRKNLKMGIDEAGRGSLIGPMIVAAVILDPKGEERLKELGVKDSKMLTPRKREMLEKEIIKNAIWYKRIAVMPSVIDEYNLNKLTLKIMKQLAEEGLRRYPELTEIIVDRVGGYKPPLLKTKSNIKQTMEKKADSKYTVVAAASIMAKTERDRIIDFYRKEYGLKGSGYPSDKKTIEWLLEKKENIPREIIRVKWRTLKRYGILIRKNNMGLDSFLGKTNANQSPG